MTEKFVPKSYEYIKVPDISIKLSTVGLCPTDYNEAIDAINIGDLEQLQRINELAESRVTQLSSLVTPITTQEMYKNPDTGVYQPEREELHREIIEHILSPIESDGSPRFHIMAGPPGVGKTAGLYLYKYSRNAVLTDPTLIQKVMVPGFDESNYTQVLATKDETFDIAEKLIDEAFERRLAITSESTLQNLQWITKALKDAEDRSYDSHIIFFHKNLAECFEDAVENRKRPVSINYLLKSIQGYENLMFFDKFPGVKVTVIDKTDQYNWKTIYDSRDGILDQNPEFLKIKKSLDAFKALVIK